MISYKSRSSTERFLVGQIKDHIPDKQLATKRDVLKYLFYKKSSALEKTKKSPALKSLICCPYSDKVQATCGGPGGCEEGEPCVVRAVKAAWINAGFKLIGDSAIR